MSRPKGSKNKIQKVKPQPLPVGVQAKYRAHPFLGKSKEDREIILGNALIKNRGLFSHAAQELQIDNATVTKLVQESDYLAHIIIEIREKLKSDIQRVGVNRVLDSSNPELQYKYWKEFIKNKNMKEFGWDNTPELQFTQNNLKQVIMNFPEPTNKFVIEGLDFDEKLLNE